MQSVSGKLSFDVHASIVVNADLTHSWDVLTGYDRMAQFVPNLTYSHVVARDGNVAIIAQHGFARLLFIRQPIDLQLQATEYPMHLIEIHRINGNMRTYEARWEAQILPEGTTRIDFSGVISPDFYIPSLFGTALMKSELRATMEAVRDEIENNKSKQ